jgi:hypothetical protein
MFYNPKTGRWKEIDAEVVASYFNKKDSRDFKLPPLPDAIPGFYKEEANRSALEAAERAWSLGKDRA